MGSEFRTGRCAQCSKPIRQTGRGRPRKYCSDACRSSAHRQRQDAWTWLDEAPAEAPAVSSLREALPDDLVALVTSSDEDVLQDLVAALAIAGRMRRHGVNARPQFAARCGALAADFDKALERHFGDVLEMR